VEKALGLSVLPLTPQIARQLGVADDTQGLVINAVDPSSDAGSKGLQRGDVLLSANYRDIKSVAGLEESIRSAKAANRAAVLLRVIQRGRPAVYVPVRLR
jgi:serine protease Do